MMAMGPQIKTGGRKLAMRSTAILGGIGTRARTKQITSTNRLIPPLIIADMR